MKELSLAAQAVLNNAFSAYDKEALYVFPAEKHAGMVAAAALRAAAAGWSDDDLTTEEYDTGWRAAMDFIDAVADELEA